MILNRFRRTLLAGILGLSLFPGLSAEAASLLSLNNQFNDKILIVDGQNETMILAGRTRRKRRRAARRERRNVRRARRDCRRFGGEFCYY